MIYVSEINNLASMLLCVKYFVTIKLADVINTYNIDKYAHANDIFSIY